MKQNRKARRRLRVEAGTLAGRYVAAGLFEVTDAGGLVRVTRPAALRALRREIAALFRAGRPTRTAPLSEAEALAFPSAVHRPPWGGRCYLALTVDRDGRIAFRTMWATSDGTAEIERQAAAEMLAPGLARWAATTGFGHPEPAGWA
jgi:hypothetical protein